METEKTDNENILYIHIKNSDNHNINIPVIILLIVCGAYSIYKGDFYQGLFFIVLTLVSCINKCFFIQDSAIISLNKETGIISRKTYNLLKLKIKDNRIFYSSINQIKAIPEYYSVDKKADLYKIELTLNNNKKFLSGICLKKEEASELKNLIQNFFNEQKI